MQNNNKNPVEGVLIHYQIGIQTNWDARFHAWLHTFT